MTMTVTVTVRRTSLDSLCKHSYTLRHARQQMSCVDCIMSQHQYNILFLCKNERIIGYCFIYLICILDTTCTPGH